MEITSKPNTDDIRIFINQSLHLYFLKENLLALNSYNNAENDYSIEITFKQNKILLQYDNKDKWTKVLEQLNKSL